MLSEFPGEADNFWWHYFSFYPVFYLSFTCVSAVSCGPVSVVILPALGASTFCFTQSWWQITISLWAFLNKVIDEGNFVMNNLDCCNAMFLNHLKFYHECIAKIIFLMKHIWVMLYSLWLKNGCKEDYLIILAWDKLLRQNKYSSGALCDLWHFSAGSGSTLKCSNLYHF